MFRKMMIAGGFALAALTAGCATAPDEASAPAAPSATAPAAPAAPAASGVSPAALAAGETTFNTRCNGCHANGVNNAPNMATLAAMTPAKIVEALTTGKMAGMGAALSAEDKANVAMYITKKPV